MPKTTKKTETTNRRSNDAPIGLRLLFSAVRDKNDTTALPVLDARHSLPVAKAIVANMHAAEPADRVDRILDAVPFMFGEPRLEVEDSSEPSHVADAAFRIGVATAWLVMQSIRGEVAR